ncbi:hypothetical protein PR002_g11203 [Phytophthora rubi]|uniref:Uncharacterized protein n=1 Tax=Phytophthora rubi TaxID=129364 RepID=A0A6A3M0U6_9STRA|nr:hypothetical protein PR002_g11203 [Phytophthora rubi]
MPNATQARGVIGAMFPEALETASWGCSGVAALLVN